VADEFDVLVAGGGIAGLTAALTAARAGSTTLTLTGGVPGGLLLSIDRIDGVPGFPQGVPGFDLCPIAQEQASDAGAAFSMAESERLEARDDHWRVTTSEGELVARTVIVATGARLKALGLPGEERLWGHGVSQCASCDAPLLRDKVAAVVGGGDSALQEALTLAGPLAQVIVLHRGDALSAQEAYVREVLEHPRIDVRYGTIVEEILGEERVTGVRTRELASGVTAEIELDAAFVFVGLEPNTGFLDGVIELDADGRIPTDAEMRTALPGLLSAGIVRSGAAGRAAASAGDGATAALSALRYVREGEWIESRPLEARAAAATGGADG
jgi:thioredoxin reductase (NADPH)